MVGKFTESVRAQLEGRGQETGPAAAGSFALSSRERGEGKGEEPVLAGAGAPHPDPLPTADGGARANNPLGARANNPANPPIQALTFGAGVLVRRPGFWIAVGAVGLVVWLLLR
jgi:hypothetical protein